MTQEVDIKKDRGAPTKGDNVGIQLKTTFRVKKKWFDEYGLEYFASVARKALKTEQERLEDLSALRKRKTK